MSAATGALTGSAVARAGALALALLLTACGAAPPIPQGTPAPATAGPDSCGRSARSALVGQQATALERVLILGPVRVNRPGDAVTRDYAATRINFDIDAGERIARIWCG